MNIISTTFKIYRSKGLYSIINLFGLAIGISCSFILFGHVLYEKSYDKFHENSANIYRVHKKTSYMGSEGVSSTVCLEVGQVLSEQCSEVANFVRFHKIFGDGMIKYNNVFFNETEIFYADNSILSVFSLNIKNGDSKTALVSPNTVMISESAAKKYFGNEVPINKDILLYDRFNSEQLYTITAVFKDIPENSHIKFEFLFSSENIKTNRRYINGWGMSNFHTYLLLNNKNVLSEEKINNILNQVKPASDKETLYFLKPLEDIHLNSNLAMEHEKNGNSTIINLLIIISLFIIIVAILNYNNITTAKALERAKEVGIKKVSGASPFLLKKQFWIESILFNIVSLILAIVIILIILPFFENSLGIKLPNLWKLPSTYLLLFSIFFVNSVLTSIYPAFVLSSFNPVLVLKGKFTMSKHGMRIRKFLTVSQYVIAIVLVIGMFAIYKQNKFMMNADLGFDLSNVLIMRSPRNTVQGTNITNKYLNFKERLCSNPEINTVSSSIYYPGLRILSQQEIYLQSESVNESKSVTFNWVDFDYLKCYDIKLLEGRDFSRDFNDSESLIVNEAFVKVFNLENNKDAINKKFVRNEQAYNVIGVIKNYKHESLQNIVEPMGIYLGNIGRDYCSIKFDNMDNIKAKIDIVKTEFNISFPENPFDYFFAQDNYNQNYSEDIQNFKVIGIFAILAILIVILGLIGFSFYFGSFKQKEICIRKILGSSIYQIFGIQFLDYLKPFLVGVVVAIPIGIWGVQKWLNMYAHKMPIKLDLFIVPVLIIFFILLLTTSYFIINLSLVQPAITLRNE